MPCPRAIGEGRPLLFVLWQARCRGIICLAPSCPGMLPGCQAARSCIHAMAAVCIKCRAPSRGPHNVAMEPPDAYPTHGRSLSANCPHREGTHSIFKLHADACAAILRTKYIFSVAKCAHRTTEDAYVPRLEPYYRDADVIDRLGTI